MTPTTKDELHKRIEALPEAQRLTAMTKDPTQFIDLLGFYSYLRGQSGNKMPVDETRLMFDLWLEAYTAAERRKAADEARLDALNSIFGMYPIVGIDRMPSSDLVDLINSIKTHIAELKGANNAR